MITSSVVEGLVSRGAGQLNGNHIRCTYLNATSKDYPVYLRLPVGLREYDPNTGQELVAYTEKAVYGRRQSGRLFEKHVENMLC